eukprot:gb/GECG01013436.1/.p1 GENE.gb/GECG01013436.1/~~gb/GECG01013436.1/.p1  ORF type:complete len:118 (+),score=10.44 gb/GECG01013436.1/:1-354(+)
MVIRALLYRYVHVTGISKASSPVCSQQMGYGLDDWTSAAWSPGTVNLHEGKIFAILTLAHSLVNLFVLQGVVLVATRQILDEELFVDHQLNPFQQLPPWYESKSVDSDSRIWRQISS